MRIIQPISLDISSVQMDCGTWSVRRPNGLPALDAALVRVTGFYPRGSAGKDDARFIRWKIDELCELRAPAAVAVDLRGLDYERGDDLSVVPPTSLIHLVVAREEQHGALAPIVGSAVLRTDLETALDEIDGFLRAFKKPVAAQRKMYLWTEIWIDTDFHREVVLLNGAADGSMDLVDPAKGAVFQSFMTEDEATSHLQKQGYARVEGRLARSDA